MITVMTVLKSNLHMVSATIMVHNGSGFMVSMSKLRSTLMPKMLAETDFLDCYKSITITSIMMNGVLFLK